MMIYFAFEKNNIQSAVVFVRGHAWLVAWYRKVNNKNNIINNNNSKTDFLIVKLSQNKVWNNCW